MMKKSIVSALLGVGMVTASVAAQTPVHVRTAVLFESYSFDEGRLGFDKVRELSVPLGVRVGLGRRAHIALSSGYANVKVTGSAGAEDLEVSGALDTELRIGMDIIPGRLTAIFTSALPTGVSQVDTVELGLLGTISSDLISFSSSSLGSGGSVGGGFVGAVPIGRWALGFGATFKQSMSYEPINGDPMTLQPGAEFRIRGGAEGPISRTSYIRIAGVFARRGKDKRDDTALNGVGNRFIGYAAFNQGLGSSQLTLYAFDVYRGSPQLESTTTGAAFLPKGNLLAVGSQFEWTFAQLSSLTPRLEYRVSHNAPTDPTQGTDLSKRGSSFRFGVDYKRRLSRAFAVVVEAGGLVGTILQPPTPDINMNGYRFGLHFELTQ